MLLKKHTGLAIFCLKENFCPLNENFKVEQCPLNLNKACAALDSDTDLHCHLNVNLLSFQSF